MKRRRTSDFAFYLYLASCLGFALIASIGISSQGISFDEHLEIMGLFDHIRSAVFSIQGKPDSSISFQENMAFYGKTYLVPALLTWAAFFQDAARDIDLTNSFAAAGNLGSNKFYAISHIYSSIYFICTSIISARLAKAVGIKHYWIVGALVIWSPLASGHSLMNPKDTFTSLIFSLYTLEATKTLLEQKSKPKKNLPILSLNVFIRSACIALLASQRLPLIIGPAIVETCTAFSRMSRKGKPSSKPLGAILGFAATLLASSLLYFVITPPAWRNTTEYVIESFRLHSNHYHPGCTWTLGECIGKATSGNEWSTFNYLVIWSWIKTPSLVPVLALLMITRAATGLRRQPFKQATTWITTFFTTPGNKLLILFPTAIQAALFPFLAAVNNSTVYGTLRHFIFCIPAFTIIFIAGCEYLGNGLKGKERFFTYVLVSFFSLFLVADIISLSPYQYTYVSETARLLPIENGTELDDLGYSSGELMQKIAATQPDKFGLVIGFRPMISVYHEVLERKDVPGGERFRADFSTDTLMKRDKSCEDLAEVTRVLLPRKQILLSRAYICNQ